MKGLYLKQRDLEFRRNLPEPERGEDELLLEVRFAGICGTDIELLQGYSGFEGVPGHEFVATVLEGPGDWTGKRVVADINITCGGKCAMCRRGLVHHCVFRHVVGIREHDGAFAEKLVIPAANAYEVPASISDQDAVLIEPLAAAFEIPEQVSFDGSERVLVIGAGRLGRLVAAVMETVSSEVEVQVRTEVRQEDFADTHVKCVKKPDGIYDVIIECTGNGEGLSIASHYIRPRGTIVLKSTYNDRTQLDASELVINEVTILGSRCGPMARAMESLASGTIDLSALSFERYPLEEYKLAFTRARSRNIYKVLLEPNA